MDDEKIVTKEFEALIKHYENFNIKFKGDPNWYFINQYDLDRMLKGVKLKGKIVKKRTRTWFE